MTQAIVNKATAEAIAALLDAAMTEVKDGYEYEDTLERVSAAGYLEGMTHLAILLGFEVHTKDSDELAKIGRGYIEDLPMYCRHADFEEVARPETEPATDGYGDWTVYDCSNCKTETVRRRNL